MTPTHPWTCLTCDAHGHTTVTANDIGGEAKRHVEESGHAVSVSGVAG